MNQLYFGDCLEVLQKLVKQNPKPFIDLIYIDPPFNSKRNYNVLFGNNGLEDTIAQKQAFSDTWSNVFYLFEMDSILSLNKNLHSFLNVLSSTKYVSKNAVSYLTTMAHRICYMHKTLKDTGSFFLHCDPTMSHYLKIICDLIFGEYNFKNELIWQRTSTHNNAKQGSKHFGHVHDVILFYSKSKRHLFNIIYKEYSEQYLAKAYNKVNEFGRRFKTSDLSGPGGAAKGNPIYTWNGVKQYWRYSYETMVKLDESSKIYYSSSGKAYLKQYLDEMKGTTVDDLWSDIKPANRNERLGYPTQKPEELLERIIKSCTKKGGLVADFFCGCGTAVSVSQKLNRNWLGVDISHLAIRIIEKRLIDTYGYEIKKQIQFHGFPKDIASAKMLARKGSTDKFSFKEWIIEVLLHGLTNDINRKITSYEGYVSFIWNLQQNFALIKVKTNRVFIKDVQALNRAIKKQKAALGIIVCFDDSKTKSSSNEAKAVGTLLQQPKVDKIQIVTIESLMNGIQPIFPLLNKERIK